MRLIGFEWRLREVMAAAGMFSTTKLVPLLEERGVYLSTSQVYRLAAEKPERMNMQALVALLSRDSDTDAVTADFDAWCRAHIRPWFLDHVHCDGERLRRWAGGGVDLGSPLPSDLVVAAAAADATARPGARPAPPPAGAR